MNASSIFISLALAAAMLAGSSLVIFTADAPRSPDEAVVFGDRPSPESSENVQKATRSVPASNESENGFARNAEAMRPSERPLGPARVDATSRFGTLPGRLVNRRGKPVAGVEVCLYSRSRRARLGVRSGTDGRFAFTALPLATDYSLSVYPVDGLEDVTISPIEVAGEENELEVVLEPVRLGSLDVELVDAEGQPVPDLPVRVRGVRTRGRSIGATSDARGRVRVDGVPCGEVLIESEGRPKLTIRGLRATETEEGPLRVRVGHHKGVLRGVVRDASGAPLPGARVIGRWACRSGDVESRLFSETVTDQTGAFAMAGFGPGDGSLSVSAAAHRPVRRAFRAPPSGCAPFEFRLALQETP